MNNTRYLYIHACMKVYLCVYVVMLVSILYVAFVVICVTMCVHVIYIIYVCVCVCMSQKVYTVVVRNSKGHHTSNGFPILLKNKFI